jgi:mRNA interferase RelE/StbE
VIRYSIVLTPAARAMLTEISDRRIREKIRQTIDRLITDPEKQGKPLLGPYLGYRSLRAVGQRYRIVYRVEHIRVMVIVIGVGLRREGDRADIYRRLQKLIHLKLI